MTVGDLATTTGDAIYFLVGPPGATEGVWYLAPDDGG